ncbi:MAG: HdeA/HdeB family chaperone [Methylocella sp.]|jgi:acid stress chaperone HdeB
MRKFAVFAVAVMAGAVVPAKAQVVLEMSAVTCEQYLKSAPEEQATLASWMSGYFNASKNVATVDLRKAERNLEVVARYCKIHKKETLMNAVQKKAR